MSDLLRSIPNCVRWPDPCRPVRVRAWLQAPVAGDGLLPLDALVFYHAVRAELGPQLVTLPRANLVKRQLRLKMPFERRVPDHDPDAWYWAASCAVWPDHTVQDVQHWTKQFDEVKAERMVDFGGRRGYVRRSSGTYRAYRMPLVIRHALYVDWYAVADPEALRWWLRWVRWIGKKTAQGWGAVKDWEVEVIDQDLSERLPDGRAVRPIPVPSSPVRWGVRPSYWDPRHRFPVVMPES